MAQHAQGWTLRLPPGSLVYTVRFRHKGRRNEKSTGQRDPKLAAVEAAKIYADVVSGRKVVRPVAADLASTVSTYLAGYEMQNSADWSKVVATYFKAHLLRFFGSFDGFTPASYGDYMRTRIQLRRSAEVTPVCSRKVVRSDGQAEGPAMLRRVSPTALHDLSSMVPP